MSTIEGGMVSTNDEEAYENLRMLRSHGMVREMSNQSFKQKYIDQNINQLNENSYFHIQHIILEILKSELLWVYLN